jgi:hypothetical protein
VSGALYLKIFGPLLQNFFRRPPPPPQCTILGVKNHDRINLNLVGAPNCRGPLVLELTLTTVRYAIVYMITIQNVETKMKLFRILLYYIFLILWSLQILYIDKPSTLHNHFS